MRFGGCFPTIGRCVRKAQTRMFCAPVFVFEHFSKSLGHGLNIAGIGQLGAASASFLECRMI